MVRANGVHPYVYGKAYLIEWLSTGVARGESVNWVPNSNRAAVGQVRSGESGK